MSVCLSYLWRFWRRKSAVFVFCLLTVVFVVAVQFTSTGSKPGRLSHSDNLAEVFKSTQKRLQQSEPQELDRRVRFLPRKNNIVKSLPVRHEVVNLIPADDKYSKRKDDTGRKYIEKSRINAFKENQFIQPYGLDNTEYDTVHKVPYVDVRAQPPVYRPVDALGRGDQPAGEGEIETPFYIPRQRLVHFDLKGAPPKLEFLLRILKWIKDAGATGILLEYEDMFPFSGRLSVVAAINHYNTSDVATILATCEHLGLEVIPLIQTFGHMEFILKHEEFAHLRDNEHMPESICACHEQTSNLLKDYIDQVLSLHPHSKSIHIGCDEVYHLGTCTSCQGLPRPHIFVNHVTQVARYIKESHKRRVIVWDDMLRNFVTAEMQPLADLVEPMVWVYAEEPYRFAPSYNWDRLAEIFPTAWTSSAFKGADGPTTTVPNLTKRLANNVNWLSLMGTEEEKFREGFRGIAITGWSRYDHFAVLSELLPVGLPSLAMALLATSHGYFNESLKSDFYNRLDCADGSHIYDTFIDLEADPYLWDKMSWCFFPGSQLFKLTRNLENVQTEVGNYLSKSQLEQGWLTDYNIRRNYSSPMRVEESLDDLPRVQFAVSNLIRHAQSALAEVYDDFTVAEWIEQKIYPMVNELAKIKSSATVLKKRRTWPSRPLPILPELKEFGVGIPQSAKTGLLANSAEQQAPSAMMSMSARDSAPPAYHYQQSQHQPVDPNGNSGAATVRPKRLVQAPDFYRHPPGSFQSEMRAKNFQ